MFDPDPDPDPALSLSTVYFMLLSFHYRPHSNPHYPFHAFHAFHVPNPNLLPSLPSHGSNQTKAFLSWLRLSVYMAIVSIAILISFHLKNQPTPLERKLSFPLGILFWLLALACLASGTANYIKTVSRYSRRQALVQTGWKTQLVSFFVYLSTLFSSFHSSALI